MFAVRTTLTDILLEVTNEEIRNIATESLSKIRLKGMILYNTHTLQWMVHLGNTLQILSCDLSGSETKFFFRISF